MMNTATTLLLDELAAWFGGSEGPVTDYRLAKDYFKTAPQQVSAWRTGKVNFADERVLSVCEDVWPGDDAAKCRWLALVHAQRAQNVHVRKVWERLAKSAAVLILAVSTAGAPPPAQAGFNSDTVCIMRNRRGRRRPPQRAQRHTVTFAASPAA